MFDIQKATVSKRISAFLFDLLIFFVLVIGLGSIFSGIVGYDEESAKPKDAMLGSGSSFAFCASCAVIPVAAKSGKGVETVISECEQFLYESDWFFSEDIVTDQPERKIASEIIREKLLRMLEEEIPHGTAVTIEEWKENL